MSFLKMTKLVLTSLFNKPSTRLYPLSKREGYNGSRGHIEIDIKGCIYCSMCQRKCPTGALVVNRNDKTWVIDRGRCISCGYCTEVCPKKVLTLKKGYSKPFVENEKETFKNA